MELLLATSLQKQKISYQRYHNYALFLLCIGMMFTDATLNAYVGFNQVYTTYPFLLISLYFINLSEPATFNKLIYVYMTLIFIFFIIDGATNWLLLSTLIGTSIIVIATVIKKFSDQTLHYGIYYFFISTLFLIVPFYLGFWETDIGNRRATFLAHNQNGLAWLLNIGLSCVFVLPSLIKFKAPIYNFMIKWAPVLYILPILLTVSRTGIAILVATFFLFMLSEAKLRRFTLLIIFFAFMFVVSDTSILDNAVFTQISDRVDEAKTDERLGLWQKGWESFTDDPILGIGFSKFSSNEWRYSKGLFAEITDEDGMTEYISSSIHNGFIDLGLIGGITLMISYISIILYLLYHGIRLYISSNRAKIGAFIIANMVTVIFFSYSGQAPTLRMTWLQFGLCYLLVANTSIKKNNQNVNKSLSREINTL